MTGRILIPKIVFGWTDLRNHIYTPNASTDATLLAGNGFIWYSQWDGTGDGSGSAVKMGVAISLGQDWDEPRNDYP